MARPGLLLAVLWIALFGLGGIVSVCMFARRLSAQIGIGKITVEVSEHPLYPGKTFRALLRRSGRRKMVWLQASLLCEEWCRPLEENSDSGGGSTRVVYTRRLAVLEGAETDPEARQKTEFELQIPPRAMHSLDVDDYRRLFGIGQFGLDWYILVEAKCSGAADTGRFPVVVYPHDYAKDHA